MFSFIRLQNFKSYKDSGEVPLAPLTIIVGVNNSGKSTLLQSLLALKQTVQDQSERSALITSGPYAQLNGFYDILHKNGEQQPLFEISVGLDTPQTLQFPFGGPKKKLSVVEIADRLDVAFGFSKEINEIEVANTTMKLGDKILLAFQKGASEWLSDEPSTAAYRNTGVELTHFLPVLALNMPTGQAITADYMEAVSKSRINAAVWSQILGRNLHQVGPLRRRVPWFVSVGTRAPSELGLGGENLIAALGGAEKVRDTNKTVLELINDWFAKKQVIKKFHIENDVAGTGRMLLGDGHNGPIGINVAGMGEGISQLLPIIARSLVGDNADCLLVEQPEIHLHPALQADLADFFIDIVLQGKRQVIVETHSEHLLLRLRRRIAEGETILADQVAILYVENDGSEAKVRRLTLDSKGLFSDWPKGFFDEAYQEAMALAEAPLRKKKATK